MVATACKRCTSVLSKPGLIAVLSAPAIIFRASSTLGRSLGMGTEVLTYPLASMFKPSRLPFRIMAPGVF